MLHQVSIAIFNWIPWIVWGEQSGLLMHIAATVDASLCDRKKS
jgi:hypothetical protein